MKQVKPAHHLSMRAKIEACVVAEDYAKVGIIWKVQANVRVRNEEEIGVGTRMDTMVQEELQVTHCLLRLIVVVHH
jgi:hypothetical protein